MQPKPVLRPVDEQIEKHELRPPIAFAKRMNGIQLRQEPSRLGDHDIEFGRKAAMLQPEQAVHLGGNVLRVAEDVAGFRRTDSPIPAGPGVHVAKEMAMNCTIVRRPKATVGESLTRAQSRHLHFESFKGRRIAYAEAVLEDGRASIAVGIVEGVVASEGHQRRLMVA